MTTETAPATATETTTNGAAPAPATTTPAEAPKRTPKPRASVDIGAAEEARIAKMEQDAREAEAKAEAAEATAKLARADATAKREGAGNARKAAVNAVLHAQGAEKRTKEIAALRERLAKLEAAGAPAPATAN